jgi:hypothetical protein
MGMPVPFTASEAHIDVARVKYGDVEYAIASRSNQIIFIPLVAYEGAGLPMHEIVENSPSVTEVISHNTDPEKRISRSPNPDSTPRPRPAPTRPIPRIISADVPFAGISDYQYGHIVDDAEVQSTLKLMSRSFRDANQKTERLSHGTFYTPLLKDTDDPNSVVIVEDGNGDAFIVIKSRNDDGSDRHGMIPKSEYDAYLQSQKADLGSRVNDSVMGPHSS